MKQILLSLVVIVVVGSLAAAGTYAGFSDTETSQGNYFETGSLDLQLGDTLPYPGGTWPYKPDEDYGQDPDGDSVLATWDYHLGYPGGMESGDWLESLVKLRNVGNIEATSLDISCHNENTAPPGGSLDKDTKMIIVELIYFNSSITPVNLLTDPDPQKRVQDMDDDGQITLHDWELDPIVGLPPPPIGTEAAVRMTVLFHPNAGNDYQGCSTMMTLFFGLMQ